MKIQEENPPPDHSHGYVLLRNQFLNQMLKKHMISENKQYNQREPFPKK